MRHLGLEPKTR